MSRTSSIEPKIAKLLHYGVITASLFLITGWLMHFGSSTHPPTTLETYHPVPLLPSLHAAFDNSDWGVGFAFLGLIVLLSLPVLRVGLTSYLYFKNREYLMALMTSAVLFLLIFSFLLGFQEF